MKNLSLQLLLFSLLQSVGCVADTPWWSVHNGTTQDYIDYAAVRRIIEQEWDRIFQPHYQNYANKNYLVEMRDYAKNDIAKTIGTACSTHTQAKKLAITLTQEYAINIVAGWAAHIARELLKNPPVNPEYIDKPALVVAVQNTIRVQAQLALSENNGRLTSLVKNLVDNVEIIIRQEIEYSYTWY